MAAHFRSTATGMRKTWVVGPAMKIVVDFESSLKTCPLIAPGAPDPHAPSRGK